jgi:DNA-binding CsgD family transcriptional regulator
MVAGALNSQLQYLGWPYDAEDPQGRARLVAELATPVGQAGEAIAAPVAAMMGSTLLLEGRWDDLRRAGETPFLWTENGQHHLLVPWAQHLALVGETARAWAAIRQFLPQGATTPPGESFFPVATGLQRLAVALALDADDLPAAREWLGAHDRWLTWSEAVLWRSEGRALWARHHRRAGAPEAARQHAEHALALATAPRQPLALLAAHRLLGELATEAGGHAEAATHLDAALALADACGTPYERALCLLALAELHAAAGQPGAAAIRLGEVRAVLIPLNVRPALARAESLAATLRRPVSPTPAPTSPAGLSPREIEVLGLLAAGQSNGAIAAALCLSPATVQRHVANIYGKIGAHNRAEATAYALRHHLA